MISTGKVRSADYYLGEVERDDAFGFAADIEGDSHYVEQRSGGERGAANMDRIIVYWRRNAHDRLRSIDERKRDVVFANSNIFR